MSHDKEEIGWHNVCLRAIYLQLIGHEERDVLWLFILPWEGLVSKIYVRVVHAQCHGIFRPSFLCLNDFD